MNENKMGNGILVVFVFGVVFVIFIFRMFLRALKGKIDERQSGRKPEQTVISQTGSVSEIETKTRTTTTRKRRAN